MAGMVTRNAI